KNYMEPKLLVVVDPYADFKPIKEGALTNIPVIALCDTKNSLKFIDVVIPCNNDSTQSIAQIFWLLAREVQLLNGNLDSPEEFEELVDLFDNRDVTKKDDDDDAEVDSDADDDEDGERSVVGVEDDDDEDDDDDDDDDDDADWNAEAN
ncbi:MAG: 30S ribosomal protein S2, partial [Pseudomonadota bacterium]